jgi:hypothetical protein
MIVSSFSFVSCKWSSCRRISMSSEPSTFFPLDTSLTISSVNAWSVSGSTLGATDVASCLFAVSLLPYLSFLYFLSRPQTETPRLGFFGFAFLLVFVFATIPAGIYAKTAYHDILANVDWLHGTAESLLTMTNLIIIAGFRKPTLSLRQISKKITPNLSDSAIAEGSDKISPVFLLIALILFFVEVSTHTNSFISFHPEPANALSLPTWAIHSSSLFEWLAAVQIIWDYAVVLLS